MPRPTITEPTDILVRVEQTAICGTDLHPYEGRLEIEADVILGHEFLGTVEAVGAAVTQISEGDRVVASCVVSCGACYQCRRHQPGNCAGSRIFGLGLALGDLAGAQAEYVVVPVADINARVIPDAGAAIDEDILFAGDIMTTGYEAVARAMRPGDTVAVVGAGPVGLCAAMAADVLGAAQVIVIDRVKQRLKEAENLGAVAVDADDVRTHRRGARSDRLARSGCRGRRRRSRKRIWCRRSRWSARADHCRSPACTPKSR